MNAFKMVNVFHNLGKHVTKRGNRFFNLPRNPSMSQTKPIETQQNKGEVKWQPR